MYTYIHYTLLVNTDVICWHAMNISISLAIMDSDGNDMCDSETERIEWLAELIPTPPSLAALAAHRSGATGRQPTQTSQTTPLLPSMQERLALLESDDSPPKVDTVPDDTYFPSNPADFR